MTKKIKIIILSVVALVVVALLITSLILFVPKKLERLIPLENIERIEYSNITDTDPDTGAIIVKELNNEEIEQFLEMVKDTKYSRRIIKIKLANSWQYNIYYTNDIVIEFGNARFDKKDGNGKSLSGMQCKLYGELASRK